MLFTGLVTIFNLLFIWFMPKRITRQEIYVTFATLSAINVATDLFLGVGDNSFYEILDPGIQKQAIPIEFLLGSSFGVIFLNFMPDKRARFFIYNLVWTIFSVCFELLSIRFHYLTYKKWNFGVSAIVYIAIFCFLRWHIHFLRRKT